MKAHRYCGASIVRAGLGSWWLWYIFTVKMVFFRESAVRITRFRGGRSSPE